MKSRYYFRQSFENCSNLQQLEHSAIGFTFASDWLKNCREIFNPITDRSNRNRVITFDSHLETTLRSQIAVPIETQAPSRFTKVPRPKTFSGLSRNGPLSCSVLAKNSVSRSFWRKYILILDSRTIFSQACWTKDEAMNYTSCLCEGFKGDKLRTSKICIFNNENSSSPRLVLAFFIFVHFVAVLVLSFFVVAT